MKLSSVFSGKYHCQGCLWCLKRFLTKDVYKSLLILKPDLVISCGSSVAPVNFIISRENLAKSIVIMRPSVLSTKRFDLSIIPRHDNPPKRKNIVVTEGALNLISRDYLAQQSERLIEDSGLRTAHAGSCIGLLIGGDTKDFRLEKDAVSEVIRQVKSAAGKNNADILVTTSRRTSGEIEHLLKEEFRDYPLCKLLVVANEKNLASAVGGILGLSKTVVVSPESISMISEAADSGCRVVVFKSKVNPRHRRFLNYMVEKEYVYLCQPDQVSLTIDRLSRKEGTLNLPKDRILVRQALSRIL